MQSGVAIMLFGFFAICWLIIAVYHLGFLGQPQGPGMLSSALMAAYTGAALSAVTAGVLILSAIFFKNED